MFRTRAEAKVSGLSGHRERLTEVLRGKLWWPRPTGGWRVDLTAALRVRKNKRCTTG